MSTRLIINLFIIILLLLTSCGQKDDKKNEEKPYLGQSIIVIAPKLRAGLISGPIVQEAEKFEEQTGAKVRIVRPGWLETIEKIKTSLSGDTLHYDVYVITTSWSGPLIAQRSIAEVPKWVKDMINWEDILPIYKNNILSWDKKTIALPYDGDVVTLYYRKDALENKEYQDRFVKKYGYPLQVPTTWAMYQDIASFFHGWDWDGDGSKEYGLVGSRLVNTSSMLIFLSRAAAYAKYPTDPAYYFDSETMAPRINNPAFVRALIDYTESLRFGPPGMINFSPSDVRDYFIEGKAMLAIDWANIGMLAADSPKTVVKEKVGYAQLPGANEVYNSKTKQWQKSFSTVSSMVGNYIFLVNKESKNKQLAFAFAAHMTAPELTKRLTTIASTGVNPSRYSHFSNPENWQELGFSTESAKEYLDTIQIALNNPNHIFDIRIPGSYQYYKSLDQGLNKVLQGEQSPQEALNTVAAKWDRITDSFGREQQLKLYRESLHLSSQ